MDSLPGCAESFYGIFARQPDVEDSTPYSSATQNAGISGKLGDKLMQTLIAERPTLVSQSVIRLREKIILPKS